MKIGLKSGSTLRAGPVMYSMISLVKTKATTVVRTSTRAEIVRRRRSSLRCSKRVRYFSPLGPGGISPGGSAG